ncbi:MAG: aspartyl/asparaginyl beta-hydroxylase domain-containing protein [Steroidobacteraceae bacterium]
MRIVDAAGPHVNRHGCRPPGTREIIGASLGLRTGAIIDRNAGFAAGTAALAAGDPRAARAHFEAIVAAGQGDAPVLVGIALAAQREGDLQAADAAVTRALELDPRNLQALLMRGDRYAATGDNRAAAAFYGAAIGIGAQTRNLAPPIVAALQRAAEARDRINAGVVRALDERLAGAGYVPGRSSARFTQSLDLLLGRRRIYRQQPHVYYFPELPQVQFYPRERFPWLADLEAATDDICAELSAVMGGREGFEPYLRSTPGVPATGDTRLMDSLDWSAYFFYRNGELVAENAARCPRTMAAIERLPLPRVRGRDPMALFSVLRPGTHIPPHTGFLNTRLICHLPLVVPPGCRFRVGNEEREWRKGAAWVFDDSIEHEAWNRGTETRVILLVDVWRPELSDEERGLVTSLLESMDAIGATPKAEWSA